MGSLEKFEELKERINKLAERKIRVEERLNSEKKGLEEIVKEIQEKGYDPKDLASLKEKKELELKKGLEDLEVEVNKVSEKLNQVDI